MEINVIIRELLAKHSYISLPGLGSFVQKYNPAKISSDGVSINPPKQYIVFDTSRTFNDEAIERYLIDSLHIDHKKASEILEKYLVGLKNDLKSGKEVLFENVGVLVQETNGNYSFKQLPDIEVATSTYGLTDVKADKSKKDILVNTKDQGDKKVVPITSIEHKTNATKIIAAAAAFLAIIVIVSVFIFIPDLRFWDRFSKEEISQTPVTENPSLKQDSLKLAQQEQVTTTPDTAKHVVDQTIQNKNEKKAALYYEEPKPQENKTFYIIVGSFNKIENAQKLSDLYAKKGFSTEIIQGNNMFRVSILKTTDKGQALGEYNKFKSENPNEAAWILGV